jgi:hypothetical protein
MAAIGFCGNFTGTVAMLPAGGRDYAPPHRDKSTVGVTGSVKNSDIFARRKTR